jgi:tetratricopeptide (TPR) repeat protein
MSWLRRNGWAFAVTLALCGAMVVSATQARRHNYRPYLYDNLYLPSGKFIDQASLGYNQLAADLTWFNAIQYYGGFRQEHHDLAYFAGLINIVTDLDPHFTFPYIFGAVVMSQDLGAFPEAVTLLRKGMTRNPQNWEFPFEIGFLYYVDQRNNQMAAQYFELAAKLPGGGDKARRFAAFIYSRAGHEHNSVRMWEELIETTDEPWMRELAERSLEKLKAKHANDAFREGFSTEQGPTTSDGTGDRDDV